MEVFETHVLNLPLLELCQGIIKQFSPLALAFLALDVVPLLDLFCPSAIVATASFQSEPSLSLSLFLFLQHRPTNAAGV
jgi:hypothetical protein